MIKEGLIMMFFKALFVSFAAAAADDTKTSTEAAAMSLCGDACKPEECMMIKEGDNKGAKTTTVPPEKAPAGGDAPADDEKNTDLPADHGDNKDTGDKDTNQRRLDDTKDENKNADGTKDAQHKTCEQAKTRMQMVPKTLNTKHVSK